MTGSGLLCLCMWSERIVRGGRSPSLWSSRMRWQAVPSSGRMIPVEAQDFDTASSTISMRASLICFSIWPCAEAGLALRQSDAQSYSKWGRSVCVWGGVMGGGGVGVEGASSPLPPGACPRAP